VALKLKTRLLVNHEYKEGKRYEAQLEESLAQYVRCRTCSAILTQDIAVTNYDSNLVLSEYEPQVKQSLATLYSNMLKAIDVDGNPSKEKASGKKKEAAPPMNQNNNYKCIDDYIDAAKTVARRQQEYLVETQIQDFQKKLHVEVKNI